MGFCYKIFLDLFCPDLQRRCHVMTQLTISMPTLTLVIKTYETIFVNVGIFWRVQLLFKQMHSAVDISTWIKPACSRSSCTQSIFEYRTQANKIQGYLMHSAFSTPFSFSPIKLGQGSQQSFFLLCWLARSLLREKLSGYFFSSLSQNTLYFKQLLARNKSGAFLILSCLTYDAQL